MLSQGVETKAHLTRAEIETSRNNKIDVIGFSWRDRAGQERTVDREIIDNGLWNRLTSGGQLVVHEAPIKYPEDDKKARAILLWEADVQLKKELRDIYVSIFFAISGALTLAFTFRKTWRRSKKA